MSNFRLIVLVLSIICFAAAAIVVRDAGHWAWLIPAGLAGFAFYHLPDSMPRPPQQ